MTMRKHSKAWSDIQAVSYNGPGKVTFDSEGQEGGQYFSRYLHVPTAGSGLTIGRGYDMKEKTATQIETELQRAGVDENSAAALAKAHGLSGAMAQKFIADNQLEDFSLTPLQQNELFKISYVNALNDVKRICSKKDVVAAYGGTNFDRLDPAIRDVLVDLRYRGDYTGATRKKLQSFVAKNDLVDFRKAVAGLTGAPKDRQERRLQALDNAIAQLPPKAPTPRIVKR